MLHRRELVALPLLSTPLPQIQRSFSAAQYFLQSSEPKFSLQQLGFRCVHLTPGADNHTRLKCYRML